MKIDKETIRQRALELTAEDGRHVGTQLASEFGVSRQVANGYMQALVRDGFLVAEGSTRGRTYALKNLVEVERTYPREGLEEDVVWREAIAPQLTDLPDSVRDIWRYGVTEMVNNAIEHSGSPEVHVGLRRNALFSDVWVIDEGEGIFLKIQRALDLPDPRLAILELAKGKLTTSPQNHTGEGIFFTSRVMDAFEIESGHLRYRHRERALDSLAERNGEAPGTRVTMRLANQSARTLRSVFDKFSDPELFTFNRTEIPVRMAQQEGEKLVSRSQARRVANRFERFKYVALDFEGITEIGQAFADELFRVFATAHPNVRLAPINTAPPVAQMIRRAVETESVG
jgi:anti-sigma regulatory factor (Ser/Thr protein kinase)/biotin operon repressor